MIRKPLGVSNVLFESLIVGGKLNIVPLVRGYSRQCHREVVLSGQNTRRFVQMLGNPPSRAGRHGPCISGSGRNDADVVDVNAQHSGNDRVTGFMDRSDKLKSGGQVGDAADKLSDEALADAKARTAVLVDTQWPAIERVANHLERRGRIHQVDLDRLIADRSEPK
jgi:hypothetical protein